MTMTRSLIVNADDFGLSAGVNRGIIEAHERGIVTSASMMVRWPAAGGAATYARSHPQLAVGLHVDLGEWAYRGERWEPVYEVVAADDRDAVVAEVARQLDVFRQLLGGEPTHLDSHQHVHRDEPLRSVLTALARDLAVPLRHCDPRVQYCGQFYGQTGKGLPFPDAISMDGLIRVLAGLPPGVTELACHPGVGDDLDSMYRGERAAEVMALCDPRVRETITAHGIDLISFRDLGREACQSRKSP